MIAPQMVFCHYSANGFLPLLRKWFFATTPQMVFCHYSANGFLPLLRKWFFATTSSAAEREVPSRALYRIRALERLFP
jgi:hypothetical protein